MKQSFRKRTLFIFCLVLLNFLCLHNQLTAEQQVFQANIPIPQNKAKKLPIEDLKRFTTVVEHIKNYYVNPVEDQALFENAIRGMLSGLDPHSSFLDHDEFSDIKANTSGKFGGLGIEVTLEDGFIRVIAPIDNTPAQKSGIKAGDLIVKINDLPVKGLSLKEAVDNMRGKPGTDLVLSIIRENIAQPLQIKVTRAIINVQSASSKALDQNFGYLRISQFQNDTANELAKQIRKLKKQMNNQLNGVVLDLRNNPGGVLDASVQVADLFLDKNKLKHHGLIVYTKGRLASSHLEEKAKSGDILQQAPIVILINEGSASASEIVAGALQDHHRAILMGTRTFGKGSVQTILPLKDNQGLKLTTAFYYTPKGRSIQAKGIEPDIVVQQLTIPTAEKAQSNLLLREADLKDHLTTSSAQHTKNTNKANSEEISTEALLHSDYQLHEALTVLKSLQFINQQKK